jgi:hypothetical protein
VNKEGTLTESSQVVFQLFNFKGTTYSGKGQAFKKPPNFLFIGNVLFCFAKKTMAP